MRVVEIHPPASIPVLCDANEMTIFDAMRGVWVAAIEHREGAQGTVHPALHRITGLQDWEGFFADLDGALVLDDLPLDRAVTIHLVGADASQAGGTLPWEDDPVLFCLRSCDPATLGEATFVTLELRCTAGMRASECFECVR